MNDLKSGFPIQRDLPKTLRRTGNNLPIDRQDKPEVTTHLEKMPVLQDCIPVGLSPDPVLDHLPVDGEVGVGVKVVVGGRGRGRGRGRGSILLVFTEAVGRAGSIGRTKGCGF